MDLEQKYKIATVMDLNQGVRFFIEGTDTSLYLTHEEAEALGYHLWMRYGCIDWT